MLNQDYLVKMLSDFALSIMRAIQRERSESSPADAAAMLETAIGEAVNLDGATFLSLAPSSIAQIMQVSGTDPKASEYIARSLLLASSYHAKAHDANMAQLRRDQAREIAHAYGHDIEDLLADLDLDDTSAAVESCEHVMEDFIQKEQEEAENQF